MITASPATKFRFSPHRCARTAAAWGLAALVSITAAFAGSMTLGPWTPLFKGVDIASGTNTPNPANPELSVAHAVRVDLTDPNVQLLPTPRITSTSYVPRVSETDGMTVSRFLQVHALQVAINANFFSTDANFGSPNYDLPENTPMVVEGQLISQGTMVAIQRSTDANTAMLFDQHNNATFITANWPAAATNGVLNAVTGLYPLVTNGVNLSRKYLNPPYNSDQVHQGGNPRTIFGLSQDNKTLYLVAIDGRQPGYSDGTYDYESANWMLLIGAFNAMNMDGGGSTTLVMANSAGAPVLLNESSAAAPNNSGQLRTVGAHFGIYAKPLPAFFNEVQALPDDVSASVTWTTSSPATAKLSYGATTNLGQVAAVSSALTTNHSALITGLQPGQQYFFDVGGATAGGPLNTSPIFSFTTTNYAVSNLLFDVTNSWKYTTANLDGVNWTAPGYNDSGWSGPGPGLLWADERGINGDVNVQPKGLQMPGNPNNSGYPYITYYFRTHFTVINPSAASALDVSAYVDDGAVFYLNGAEVERLRMSASPALIGNTTLAIGYPCSGDATCPDEFPVATAGSLLVNGDNVFAVEVHNYNALSPDITFGMAPTLSSPVGAPPQIQVSSTNGTPLVNWSRNGFSLQQAASPGGPWVDVPGPVVASPYAPAPTNSAVFYRLHR